MSSNHQHDSTTLAYRAVAGPRKLLVPTDNENVLADPEMIRLHALAASVAVGNISILIIGETGSGKEILAEAIHRHSRRAGGMFLRLNCAALTESLLESELFGYEKGAFTGAAHSKAGLLETANGGTVFLDEVGEMPLSLQATLLRVIEDGEVMRVGGRQACPVDVRVVSATNRDLEAQVQQGHFRKDLYYRLAGATLVVPPLRARPSEIEPLARLFLTRAALQAERTPPPVLSPAALDRLRAHQWPGNVRELRNVMHRAALLCQTGVIGVEDLGLERSSAAMAALLGGGVHGNAAGFGLHTPVPLPLDGRELAGVRGGTGGGDGGGGTDDDGAAAFDRLPAALAQLDERGRIVAALQHCAGNQTHAARLLGISRGTLVSRLTEYGLPRPRKRRLVP